jgi:hypothetical protein
MGHDEKRRDDSVSGNLPDHFDLTLGRLHDLPGAVQTSQATVQTILPLVGRAITYIVQTIRWDEGETVFLQALGAEQSLRLVLPPAVTRIIARQAAAASQTLRKRHGRRLAAERKAQGIQPGFMKRPGKGRRAK